MRNQIHLPNQKKDLQVRDDTMHWKLQGQTIHKAKSWRGTWPLAIEMMSNVTNSVGTQTVDNQNVLTSNDDNSKNVQGTNYSCTY